MGTLRAGRLGVANLCSFGGELDAEGSSRACSPAAVSFVFVFADGVIEAAGAASTGCSLLAFP